MNLHDHTSNEQARLNRAFQAKYRSPTERIEIRGTRVFIIASGHAVPWCSLQMARDLLREYL